MRSRILRSALVLILAAPACWPALSAQAAVPATARVQDRDWIAFLGPFPAPDSQGGQADLAILLWLQQARNAPEVARALSEVKVHFGLFSEAAGVDLESGRFPRTRALLEAALADLREVSRGAKQHFARPRPYVTDPRIVPAVPLEPSFSYPSGHSAWGTVTGAVLARLAPTRAAALLACGRQVGYDRALAGVHYPSDVDAGQRLGAALAAQWLADPSRARQVEEIRMAEWGAAASR